MNHRKEKTVITVETFQRTVIYSRRKAKIAWCKQCAAETVMFAPNEAAAIANISEAAVFRLAEADEIHSTETESGSLMICGDSLAAQAKE